MAFLYIINPLPDDKVLEGTNLRAFAEDKLNVTKIMISLYDRVENTVGKGENAGYQHFSISHSVFQSLVLWVFKSRDRVVES